MPHTPDIPLRESERLLKHGVASHRRGWETVGGRLYLTDRRLMFQPHLFNLQIEEWCVGLTEVEEVRAFLTLGFIPNGLSVVTSDGEERFLVRDRHGWVKTIWQAVRHTDG